MQVTLTPDLATFVQDKLKSGCYPTVDEVVRDGLRLLQQQDELAEVRLRELRAEIQLGVADWEAGRVSPLDIESIKSQVREQRLTTK
jgi:antitoxin ParD1/3/4